MAPLLLVLASGAVLLVAYFTYGRWLSRRIFETEGTDADARTTPAHALNDDVDFVPTKRSVLFGHHFTSIAGTGPIVGPAIAVMWGWLPAILWVVFGSIFVGAVHDLGSLVVSLRNKGRSIGDVAGDLLGPRVRLIFLCILIVGLWIVLAIFGLVIAAVLRTYPAAVTPVLIQIPLAIGIGIFIHRAGKSIFIPSLIALVLMYASVIWGDVGILHDFNTFMASQPTWIWTAGLLIYCYIASVLPVWVLLQPRDYINALQLITCLALITIGLFVAATLGGAPDDLPYSHPLPVEEGGTPDLSGVTGEESSSSRPELELVAPMIDWQPTGAPPMLPVLFITIACGACSGFHCLVASGTTSKQVNAERDARPVAYGSMLTEGFLATLVIAACAAGIGLGANYGFDVPTAFYIEDGRRYELASQDIWSPDSTHASFVFYHRNAPVDEHGTITGPFEPGGIDVVARTKIFGWGVRERSGGKPDFHSIGMDGGRILIPPGPSHVRAKLQFGTVTQLADGAIELHGPLAFDTKYQSWSSSSGLANPVGAFVEGAANFLRALGIPLQVAIALMAVMVASFAATTLDTACRLQRYVIQEFATTFLPKRKGASCPACGYDLSNTAPSNANTYTCPECGKTNTHADVMTPTRATRQRAAAPLNPFKWLATTHGATLFAVITAFILAMLPRGLQWPNVRTGFIPGTPTAIAPPQSPMPFFDGLWHILQSGGSGGMILWPLFGATNQLLAGFAFIVIAAWLIARKKPIWFLIIPAIFMLAVPAWAMAWQAFIGNTDNPSWWSEGNMLLVSVATITLLLEAWLLIEVFVRWRSGRAHALLANAARPS